MSRRLIPHWSWQDLKRITRSGNWIESKLPFLLWLGAVAHAGHADDWSTLVLLYGFTAAYLAFGYSFNDLCDLEADLRSGKTSPVSHLSAAGRWVVPGVCLVACLGSMVWPHLFNGTRLWMAAALLAAYAYSAPFPQMKVRGFAGVVWGAAAQWTLPLFLFLQQFRAWPVLYPTIALATAVGIRWMLIHQRVDQVRDRAGAVATFGAAKGDDALGRLIRAALAIEYMLVLLFLCELTFTGNVVLAGAMGAAFLFSIVTEHAQKVRWNRDFGHVSLAGFYLLWGPITAYLALTVSQGWALAVMCVHMLCVRRFLWGNIQSIWFDVFRSRFRC